MKNTENFIGWRALPWFVLCVQAHARTIVQRQLTNHFVGSNIANARIQGHSTLLGYCDGRIEIKCGLSQTFWHIQPIANIRKLRILRLISKLISILVENVKLHCPPDGLISLMYIFGNADVHNLGY